MAQVHECGIISNVHFLEDILRHLNRGSSAGNCGAPLPFQTMSVRIFFLSFVSLTTFAGQPNALNASIQP